MDNDLIKAGQGIETRLVDGTWVIDSTSGAVIIEDIKGSNIKKGDTVQSALYSLFNTVLPNIPLINTANMFKTDSMGIDPEYPSVSGLRGDAIYIRFEFTNISEPMYVSCWMIQSEIERLDSKLEGAPSGSDFKALQDIVSTKAGQEQLNLLKTSIDEKADNSSFKALQDIVSTKAGQEQLNLLKTSIDEKTDNSSFKALQNTVDELIERTSNIQDDTVISGIINDITLINNRLSSYAEKTDIDNINRILKTKANSSDLSRLEYKVDNIGTVSIDNLTGRVSDLENKTSNLETIASDINNTVKKKANLSYVESIDNDLKKKISAIEKEIINKADGNGTSERLKNIDNNINTITNNINSIYYSLDNNYSTIKYSDSQYQTLLHKINENYINYRNEVTNIYRRLNDINNRLTDTNKELLSVSELASKQWIQVLTPEQYNRLPIASIDPAKIYMCVKYNKPYAMYVGTILIAKRDSKSSNGFAYTFPLAF